MSEGETHLSSRRAAASRSVPPRSAQDPGADIDERQASHHTAGLPSHGLPRDIITLCAVCSQRDGGKNTITY